MNHQHGYRKLGKESSHRRAMLRNMATDFMVHGKINTTLPRAKELRSIVERIITLGKRGDLHARRQAASYLFDDKAVKAVFDEIAPKFKETPGGYTRILKTGVRFGDGAKLARLELCDPANPRQKKAKK
jgi:large subunit ribosomal protein L17